MIASLQEGAVSYLYYADRLYELPLAIVGIAIGVVLLPDVSRHLRAGDHAAVMDSQNRSLEFAMLLTVPAAVALAVVPHQIVSVLFERGAFHAADTPRRRQCARHLRARAAVVRADQGVLAGLFRARGHPHADALCRHQPDRQHGGLDRAVLRCSGGSAACRTSASPWPPRSAAGSTPCCSIARCVARGYFVADARLGRVLPMILLASVIMGVALWLTADWLDPWLVPTQGVLTRGTALATHGGHRAAGLCGRNPGNRRHSACASCAASCAGRRVPERLPSRHGHAITRAVRNERSP